MKDIDIIKLYFARSENAIRESSKKYGAYLMTVAENILASTEDSRECVNDTYLRAWNSIPPKNPDNLRTYLGKITRGLAINRYKMYSAEKRGGSTADIILSELEGCIPSNNNVEDTYDEKRLIKLLEAFLRGESEEKQRLFILRYWYCESIAVIAKRMRMSESRVTTTLFRQRKRLKEYLEKEGVTIER